MEVEVVFPYEPQHDDELRLTVGSVITNVTSLETGWYRGSLGNGNGVFPDNFVKVLSKEPKNASTENGLATSPPNVQKREMGGRRCRVVFSYAPQHDDELTLCVGQTITILQEVEEGWWKGVLDGQVSQSVGMFPSNFVEDFAEGETTTTAKSAESSNLENINNQLNVNGEQKGQVKEFRDLPHRLPPALEPKADKITSKTDKTRINAADKERISSLDKDRITITIRDEKAKGEQPTKRGDLPPSTGDDISPQAPPPQLPPKPVSSGKVRELARVMFPYAAEHEDELELKEGDIITILCKELEDKGWWRGEIAGHVGVFPDNFVELLTIEETAKPPRPEKPAAVLAKKSSPSSSADSTPTGTLNKTDKEPPPPLPEKKVHGPPPPEKKTGGGGTVQTTTDSTDGTTASKEQNDPNMMKLLRGKSSTKEDPSLSLDVESERLTHVTQNRPKGPSKRRPPSVVFKENMKNQISADSDTLLPTSEDELEDVEANNQLNGHLGTNEIPRSPSVPSLVQPSAKPPTPVTSPTSGKPIVDVRSKPEAGKDVPWLQELRLNQKKKISGVFNSDDVMTSSEPIPSLKPVTVPQKPDDKSSSKPVKPVPARPDSVASEVKAKHTEPRIPSPDYDSKTSPALQPSLTKGKPLPRTPLSTSNIETKKTESQPMPPVADSRKLFSDGTDGRKLLADGKKPLPTNDPKKTINTTEAKENKLASVLPKDSRSTDNSLIEEKVNAVYKELLPKIKMLEDKLEESHKHQSHCIQMLMSELDEERKKRACMEVEIERLKKLVNPYAQV